MCDFTRHGASGGLKAVENEQKEEQKKKKKKKNVGPNLRINRKIRNFSSVFKSCGKIIFTASSNGEQS